MQPHIVVFAVMPPDPDKVSISVDAGAAIVDQAVRASRYFPGVVAFVPPNKPGHEAAGKRAAFAALNVSGEHVDTAELIELIMRALQLRAEEHDLREVQFEDHRH